MKIIVFILLSLSLSYGYVYEFEAKNFYDKSINFEDFEDEVLVLFVANKELKTDNQLRKLNQLYSQYKSEDVLFVGFAVKDLNVTSNDFCVINYGVDFDMIGIINNKLSRLRKYMLHIYQTEILDMYAPILIHNRKILRFSNIDDLKDELIDMFGTKWYNIIIKKQGKICIKF